VVNQRELRRDAHSIQAAMHAALRQDTDVIVIGELQNAETIRLALTAAETGHLVMSTLSTPDAIQTIDRLIDLFPAHQQPQVRMQVSVNLVGVVSQVLVKMKDGAGRAAAFETLAGIPTVRSLVRDGKTSQIHALMQNGAKQGMITRDQSLANLVKKGSVTYEAALEHAYNLTEFHFLCTDGQSMETKEGAG
jgi:twitching motility protein PilT